MLKRLICKAFKKSKIYQGYNATLSIQDSHGQWIEIGNSDNVYVEVER